MANSEGASAGHYGPVQREAVSILHMVMESVHAIRPMPDGTQLVVLALDVSGFDRLCEWGASIEDLEPEEEGADNRELAPVRTPLPEVFPASRLIPSPAVAEISALRWVPRELRALAARIGEPAEPIERAA